MSIIDELLVLLDEQEGLDINKVKKFLPKKTKQSISSALGRIVSKGIAKKNNKDGTFQITSLGREIVTESLNHIRELESNKWDGSWTFVIFNIPEKLRKFRDIFRKELVGTGFVRAQGELWVAFGNKKPSIKQTIKKNKLERYATVFAVDKLTNSDQKDLLSVLIWNKKELNLGYQKFITDGEKFLKLDKNGFKARLLVFSYSRILAIDPKFPNELQPKDYLGDKAYKIYHKIRPYCYK